MAAFDQSFDSTVYARVKFDISKAKEFLKKLSEKTKKEINLTIYWIKVVGDVFVRVPESNEKIRFGLKGNRKTVDISIIINAKGNEMTYLTIRDVPNKTFEQVFDEYLAKSEKLKKGQDEAYNKTRYFLKFIPSFCMDIVMELMGILSMINISIPCIGLKKNHYGSVILSLMGGYGLKNIYVPLFPYTYTIGVFSSCEIEEKKTLNLDGSISVNEYLPVNFTLDHRYMDGVLSSKMVKAARTLFDDPNEFKVKESI